MELDFELYTSLQVKIIRQIPYSSRPSFSMNVSNFVNDNKYTRIYN